MSGAMDDSLDAVIRNTLRDIRGLSEEGAARRLHGLSRTVRKHSSPTDPKHADRLALLRQAWVDLAPRCSSTPSAEELAAWVGAS